MKYIHFFYISAVAAAFFLGYQLKTKDDAEVLSASQPAAVSNHAVEPANSGFSEQFVRQSAVKETVASANVEKDIAAESEHSKKQAVSLEEREEYLKKMGEKIIERQNERQKLQSDAAEQQNHDNGREEILLTKQGEIPEEDRERIGMIKFSEQQAVPAVRDLDGEKDNLFKRLKESGKTEEAAKQTAEQMFAHEASSEEAEQKKTEKASAHLSHFFNSLPDANEMEKLSNEERERIGKSIWEQREQ